MKNLSWMKRTYCRERWPALKKPGLASFAGELWAFCSNGHYFIAVKSDNGFDRVPDMDKHAAAVMSRKPADGKAHIVSLAKLQEWLEPPEWDKPCKRCDGDGCEHCDYTGGTFADPRHAKLFGIKISRNFLARALDKFNDDTVRITFTGNETVFFLEGDGWLVGQMPCRFVETNIEFSEEEVPARLCGGES